MHQMYRMSIWKWIDPNKKKPLTNNHIPIKD